MKDNLKTIISLFILSFLLSVVILHGNSIPAPFFKQFPQMATIFFSIVIQALPGGTLFISLKNRVI